MLGYLISSYSIPFNSVRCSRCSAFLEEDTGFVTPALSSLDCRAFTRVWIRSTLQYVNFRLFGFLLLTKKAQERQTDRCEIEKAALLLLNRKIPFIGGVLPSLLALDDWKWKKRADIEIDRPYGMRFFRPRLLRMFEHNTHSLIYTSS